MKLFAAKNFVGLASVITLLSACGSPYNASYNSPHGAPQFSDAESISAIKPTNSAPAVLSLENISAAQDPIAAAPTPKTAQSPAQNLPTEAPSEPQPFAFEKPELGSLASKLALYKMPEYTESWGIRRELYEKVAAYYNQNRQFIRNPDYVTIVDFSKRSNEKRFFIVDLRKVKVIPLHTTHGTNSDPQNKGMATEFSNTEDSLQSSLGFFLTMDPYEGLNGYSLRLHGIEASNSNAEKRGIVIHSAPYVSEDFGRAGRSWGCLALDPKVSRAVINHLMNGSLLYIGK
jgi:hypothetical protein